METTLEYYDEEKSRWKWLILFASFWTHAITWGLAFTAGIFQVIFMDVFGGPGKTSMISIISTLLTACLTFFGLLASVLTNRFGHVKVGWTGTILAIIGFVLSSRADSIWFLYFTFSLIGIGFSFQYLPSVTIVCEYFTRRHHLAMGIASSGAPMGTLIFPPLVRLLVNYFSWRGAMLALAAVCLTMGVASSLFRPIKSPDSHEAPPSTVDNNLSDTVKKRKRKIIRIKLLRQPDFVCLLFNNFAVIFGYVSFYMYLPAYLITVGVSKGGTAAHYENSTLTHTFDDERASDTGWTVKDDVICAKTKDGHGLIVLCGVFGLGSNAMGIFLPSLIEQIAGKEAISDGYGYVLIAEGFGCLLGPFLSGAVYDTTNSFLGSLCLAGGVALLGCLATITTQILRTVKNRKKTREFEMFRQLSMVSTRRLVSATTRSTSSSGDSGFIEEEGIILKKFSVDGSDEEEDDIKEAIHILRQI